MSHCQKILDALRDGQWKTTAQLYRDCGPMILHSRISDLRHKGHPVEGRHVPGRTGAHGYEYRLTDSAPGDATLSGRPLSSGPNTAATMLGGGREHVPRPQGPVLPRNTAPAAEQLTLVVAPQHYDI